MGLVRVTFHVEPQADERARVAAQLGSAWPDWLVPTNSSPTDGTPVRRRSAQQACSATKKEGANMTTGLPLSGKAALVTGGAGGDWKCVGARALVRDGAAVTPMGRTRDTLEATAAELRAS